MDVYGPSSVKLKAGFKKPIKPDSSHMFVCLSILYIDQRYSGMIQD